jgi:predicted GIY-YIG superfamily endonuclease
MRGVSKDWAAMDGAFLYVLRCADGSYYVGTSRKDLEVRVAEHNSGMLGGYTARRRPSACSLLNILTQSRMPSRRNGR